MRKIALFSTTDIQEIDYHNPGKPRSTGNLERAIALGFTVYVVTTRHKLGEADKWWFPLPYRVLLATTPMDDSCSASPGLIAPWIKLYEELGIPLPVKDRSLDDEEWLKDELEGPLPALDGFNNWLDARDNIMLNSVPDAIIVSGNLFSERNAARLANMMAHRAREIGERNERNS